MAAKSLNDVRSWQILLQKSVMTSGRGRPERAACDPLPNEGDGLTLPLPN